MTAEKVSLAQQGTPILRHVWCTQCAAEAHFLWNPTQEQYLCLRCRGVLFRDGDAGPYETRQNPAIDASKPWSPPPLPERYHEHLQQARYLGERSATEPKPEH